MLGIPGTGSHLYVTGVQPEWDTKENLSLQFMFKSAADEDKELQANPTGISVSIENRGTDGQVRSEWTSVYICVDGQEANALHGPVFMDARSFFLAGQRS